MTSIHGLHSPVSLAGQMAARGGSAMGSKLCPLKARCGRTCNSPSLEASESVDAFKQGQAVRVGSTVEESWCGGRRNRHACTTS